MPGFFLLFFLSLNVEAQIPGIGQRSFTLTDKSRNRNFVTHVWYPVSSSEKMVAQGRGPFLPVMAAKDAPLLKDPKAFPLVLISHGSGGKADKLFWLTSHLVRNGLIVVGVDHTGTMTGDNSADGLMRVWDRARDLSFALDEVLKQDAFKTRVDLNKIAAAGHSVGATTVLMLGGGRFSSERLTSPVPACEGTKDPYYSKICDEFKKLDFKTYPKSLVEGDYSDSRVKAVVAYDPGYIRSFELGSLKKMKATAHLFVADKLNTPQDEILSKEFAKYFPAPQVEIIPDSYHMTYLSPCRPDFPKDDPELKELCVGNTKKIELQEEVAKKTFSFIQNLWGKVP